MSRKLVWFYNLVFCLAVVATLGFTAPALVSQPVAFAGIHLPVLLVLFLVDWALSKLTRRHRWFVAPPGAFGLLLGFTAIGGFGWCLLAIPLLVISLWSTRDNLHRRVMA